MEGSIKFQNPGLWVGLMYDDETGKETGFLCGGCGQSKANKELSLEMQVDTSTKPICIECHRSFMPPRSTASKLMGGA